MAVASKERSTSLSKYRAASSFAPPYLHRDVRVQQHENLDDSTSQSGNFHPCGLRSCGSTGDRSMPIYVDADACPVKDEVFRVARRYGIKVYVVANAPLRVPPEDLIELVVVRGGFDAADNWIVEAIGAGDIAITADIPLADRCLRRGARVLGMKGTEYTEESIGDAVATRALLEMLRQSGEFSGGPAPFAKSDRSRFLSKLDEIDPEYPPRETKADIGRADDGGVTDGNPASSARIPKRSSLCSGTAIGDNNGWDAIALTFLRLCHAHLDRRRRTKHPKESQDCSRGDQEHGRGSRRRAGGTHPIRSLSVRPGPGRPPAGSGFRVQPAGDLHGTVAPAWPS